MKYIRLGKTTIRLTVILLFLTAVPAVASFSNNSQSFKDDPSVPWHITADEINYDHTLNQYIAKGQVKITKKDTETHRKNLGGCRFVKLIGEYGWRT